MTAWRELGLTLVCYTLQAGAVALGFAAAKSHPHREGGEADTWTGDHGNDGFPPNMLPSSHPPLGSKPASLPSRGDDLDEIASISLYTVSDNGTPSGESGKEVHLRPPNRPQPDRNLSRPAARPRPRTSRSPPPPPPPRRHRRRHLQGGRAASTEEGGGTAAVAAQTTTDSGESKNNGNDGKEKSGLNAGEIDDNRHGSGKGTVRSSLEDYEKATAIKRNMKTPRIGVRSSNGEEYKWEGSSAHEDNAYNAPLVPSFCPLEPFQRFVTLQRNITQGRLPQRYLVYRPYLVCGMGNRLSGFQGVLALAVATDRALLVDWYGGVAGRRNVGKYEDNFLKPHGIPHSTIPSALRDYENMPGTQIWCQMTNVVQQKTKCVPDRITPDFLATASWEEIYAEEATVVVVQAHNNNPFMYLSTNVDPGVVVKLSELDREFGVDAFTLCAMRFLYQPRPDFRRHFCDERSAVLDGKFPSVSLHIRTGDNKKYHSEWRESLPQDVENFMACAAGLDEGLALVAADSSETFDVDFESTETVWLLGTDCDDVIDILNQGNHTVAYGGKVAFIEGAEDHRAHSGTKGGSATNEGPLMDMAMLSESVLLAGSSRSTFSLHIAEVGGLPRPLRLNMLTPFSKMFGSRDLPGMSPAVQFEDFRQGCRDFVTNPGVRDDLHAALRAYNDPFINCTGS